MAEKLNDNIILASLISHPTIESAAECVGVSPRTIYRRLEDPEFRKLLEYAQYQIISYTTHILTFANLQAVTKLINLLDAHSENVQLQAARLIIELGLKLRGDVQLEERIKTIEDLANKSSLKG